jgi:hypothetical protein
MTAWCQRTPSGGRGASGSKELERSGEAGGLTKVGTVGLPGEAQSRRMKARPSRQNGLTLAVTLLRSMLTYKPAQASRTPVATYGRVPGCKSAASHLNPTHARRDMLDSYRGGRQMGAGNVPKL